MALRCLLRFQRNSLWLSLVEVYIDMVQRVWGYQFFFFNFSATVIGLGHGRLLILQRIFF